MYIQIYTCTQNFFYYCWKFFCSYNSVFLLYLSGFSLRSCIKECITSLEDTRISSDFSNQALKHFLTLDHFSLSPLRNELFRLNANISFSSKQKEQWKRKRDWSLFSSSYPCRSLSLSLIYSPRTHLPTY